MEVMVAFAPYFGEAAATAHQTLAPFLDNLKIESLNDYNIARTPDKASNAFVN